ncbi:MAG: pirin family protein [Nocardioides sp.]
MTVAVRRGTDRFVERALSRVSRHGFSFGSAHHPEHVAFGPLIAHHEDLLGSGVGYETHRHEDVELVTWVVSGALVHTDPSGSTYLEAGSVAVTSAGTGIEHSEVAGDAATRFVQMWLRPDEPGGSSDRSVTTPAAGGVVRLVGAGGLPLRVAGAALDLVWLDAGETVALPAAPLVHAYVVSGALARSSLAQPLAAGDAFLMDDEPAHEITATVPTVLLVWSFAGIPM